MGKLVPVVLCGGAGTRLCPLSRPSRPKPLNPATAVIGLNDVVVVATKDAILVAHKCTDDEICETVQWLDELKRRG